MAEASAPPSVCRSEPLNPKQLKDMAEAAETLMQISGEKHDDNNSIKKKKKTKPMMKRENAPEFEKKMVQREKVPDSNDDNNNNNKTVKREKVADFGKNRAVKLVADSENGEDEISEESFRPKKQKYRSLRDIYKATEPVSTTKVPTSENDQNKGEEVTSATDVRKEAKSFGRPKKQNYRSTGLFAIYTRPRSR